MKASVFAVLSGAAAVIASPAHHHHKRVYETQWTTVTDVVYVTGGATQPTSTPVAPAAPVAEVTTVTKGPEVEPIYTTTSAPATTTPTTVQEAASTTTYAATDMPGAALHHHNLHRSNHSAPAMSWKDDIASAAQVAADSCVFEHKMNVNGLSYGQNLAMWGTSDNAAALGEAGAIELATTNMWYNGEYGSYASYFGQNPNMGTFESWGHISQLLWADSTGLGCAVKLCKKGTMFSTMDAWYMVCNYYPAGNVGGQYADNVKAPLGDASVSVST